MMHAGCVFVTSIHPSRTWMSGSFQSVRWNACVHRLDLCLYSHLKDFLGNGVRTHVNSKGNISSTGDSEEVWTHNAASRRTANLPHYWLSNSGPYILSDWYDLSRESGFQFLDLSFLSKALYHQATKRLGTGRHLPNNSNNKKHNSKTKAKK